MPEPIRSRANPLVKRLRARKADETTCVLEGGKLLVEALAAGVRIHEVAASPRADGTPAVEAAVRARVAVRWIDDTLLASVSDVETAQGVLAIAERPRLDRREWLRARAPLALVAVEVQNPANLGGLLRTAEAAGAAGAVLTRGCADPFSWKALRGSMGSAFRLPLLGGLTWPEARDALRSHRLRLVALDGGGERDLWRADLTGACAMLLGNEGRGLPADVVAEADERVRIALTAPVESLNVGVAAGVALFEAARQRRAQT
jgi:TrmH family RNA methyltransferase